MGEFYRRSCGRCCLGPQVGDIIVALVKVDNERVVGVGLGRFESVLYGELLEYRHDLAETG